MQRRTLALSVRLGIAVVLGCVPALAQYQLKNLVSNQIGAATHTDPADRERMGAGSRAWQPRPAVGNRVRRRSGAQREEKPVVLYGGSGGYGGILWADCVPLGEGCFSGGRLKGRPFELEGTVRIRPSPA